MENKLLVFRFQNKEDTYSFENKVCFVNDPKLVNVLLKTNINNSDSALMIESLENTQISDVIQIKVNIKNTGSMLINFKNDSLNEEARKQIINEISNLKTKEEPTLDISQNKIKKVIEIVNAFNPIYIAYYQKGTIRIEDKNIEELLGKLTLNCPILILKKENSTENGISKLNIDNIFTIIFSGLLSFACMISILETLNHDSLNIFFFIMTAIFVCVLSYSIYLSLFKKSILDLKSKLITTIICIGVGSMLGYIIGFLLTKFVLCNDGKILEIKKNVIISLPLSLVLSYASIGLGKLIQILKPKFIKKP